MNNISELIDIMDKKDKNYVSIPIIGGNEFLGSEWESKEKEWFRRQTEYDCGRYPLLIDIETSNKCNLRCKMCNIDFSNNIMEHDTFLSIMDHFSENKPFSIKFNWRGEPLLNKRLPGMIFAAKSFYGIKETQLNTNATLLTPEFADRLIKAGLDRIKISIDSINPQKYKYIRGFSLEKVLKNIDMLDELKRKNGSLFPIIHIQTVYLEDTKDDVYDYYKFWLNKGYVGYIGFCRQHGTERKISGEFPCPQLFQRLTVSWDGDITVCCMDRNLELKQGNVAIDSFSDIWKSQSKQNLIRHHISGHSSKIPLCKTCQINKEFINESNNSLMF